ncbi:MAG: hypothetical protein ABJB34_12390, partial [Acidobacteriota bacterium]
SRLRESNDAMSLRVIVKGKENNAGRQWKEVASDLISISATGSSFKLARSCAVGTLIELTIPLPLHMRCYDYDKESYTVWGLVQHSEPMSVSGASNFYVGVAFVGKDCPESYTVDPTQQYRVSGVSEDGMWNLTELERPFKKRADVRFWRNVGLYLALVDTKDRASGGESTIAENVSRHGAAVFTTMMDIGIGDRVKFISEKYDFSGLAVVCNVQNVNEGRNRLHIKFVENTFPIGSLMRPEIAVNRI